MWAPPFLIYFLKEMGRWRWMGWMAPAFLIFFLILTGRWSPPFTTWGERSKDITLRRKRKREDDHLHFHYSYFSWRGWGDGHLHPAYSSLRDGAMTTSILLFFQGVRNRELFTSICLVFPQRGWGDGHLHAALLYSRTISESWRTTMMINRKAMRNIIN
jgi:hypothetical protein